MKVCYMNDEQKDITVRIIDNNYDLNGGDNSHTYHRLKSCETKVFDVDVPEPCILFIKKWKELVMITYIDPSALAQLQLIPPPTDAS